MNSSAPSHRSGWDPKDLLHRLDTGKILFNQVKNTNHQRYFIGRMGNEREKIINENGRRIGVLNSNTWTWSLILNDVFIYGGINLGANFYLWNRPTASELKIINMKYRAKEISMQNLISEMLPDVNFPLLMRVPASEKVKAQPSVTAREIELLLDNDYHLVNKKQLSIKQYHSSEYTRNHYQYRFMPLMQKRQALSIEKHIRMMRSER